ncbi:MAG: GNAT family N-acetyltransferase [Candidatus Omnitrophica bacterium]|nr:GNAT family N-acetyltransferase [Candidatus Omnitrophota bacterium]
MTILRTILAKDAFDKLVLPDPERNLFSSPSWVRVIMRAYGVKVFVKYIERNGKIDAYVFYTVVKNFLEWKVCVLSYCDYCDAHISSVEDWQAIFNELRREYPKFRIVVRSLRDEGVRQSGCFQELSREYYHCLDIALDVDTLWKNLKGVFRNQVRQAVRKGLTVRPLFRHELYAFFMMHVRLRKRKYGIFAQPYRFFEVVWDEFVSRDKGFILGAFAPDGRLIGGTMYLVCGETLYYKINTSTLGTLEYRSNNLLLWEGIRMACERGLKFVDLGSSGLHQDGLVAFKDSTGAGRMEIVHVGHHPQGYVFSQKRILKVYTRLFNAPSVPDRVTCWGSSLIYHFLA